MYNSLNSSIFIERANKIWSNEYDYSKTVYSSSLVKIIVICKKHGEFKQLPWNHLKYGCAKCGREINKRNIILKEECKRNFISKACLVHNSSYEYSKSIYVTSILKLTVTCKIHGDFMISPNNHLRGKGCNLCANKKRIAGVTKRFNDYCVKFKEKHGDTYDYSSVEWYNASLPITVICKKHGEFKITPYNHQKGTGCQKCSNNYSSISLDWLLFMQVSYNIEIQHAKNNGEFIIPTTRYKADGYCETINTIFEFYGDFWHGNPNIYDMEKINPITGISFQKLYDKTIEKSNFIKKSGYKLVEIWENDWRKFIKSIRSVQKKWKSINNNENAKIKITSN
jgi:hypothetical protein